MSNPVSDPTSDHAPDPVADLSKAPMPTADMLRKRQSVPLQLTRFAVFNARIMRMVLKGHHAP